MVIKLSKKSVKKRFERSFFVGDQLVVDLYGGIWHTVCGLIHGCYF